MSLDDTWKRNSNQLKTFQNKWSNQDTLCYVKEHFEFFERISKLPFNYGTVKKLNKFQQQYVIILSV